MILGVAKFDTKSCNRRTDRFNSDVETLLKLLGEYYAMGRKVALPLYHKIAGPLFHQMGKPTWSTIRVVGYSWLDILSV